MAGVFASEDAQALVTRVFDRYLTLMRKVQKTYWCAYFSERSFLPLVSMGLQGLSWLRCLLHAASACSIPARVQPVQLLLLLAVLEGGFRQWHTQALALHSSCTPCPGRS